MITLPNDLIQNGVEESPLILSSEQTSPLTGSIQSVTSPFVKWQVKFHYPKLTEEQAAKMRAIKSQAGQDDLRVPLYRPHQNEQTSGVIVTSAAVASGGKTINVSGVNPSYAFKMGRFITIIVAGRAYLHCLAADSPAGSATRTLQLTGATRVAVPNASSILVEPAYIQGSFTGDVSQTADDAGFYTASLVVVERK